MIEIVKNSFLFAGKTAAYALGVASASKLGCLGFRVIHNFTKDVEFLKQCADWAKGFGLMPYAESDIEEAETKELFKQVVVLAAAAAIIHEASCYFQEAPSKIFNTFLSITPIEVKSTSIIKSVKAVVEGFDAKALLWK